LKTKKIPMRICVQSKLKCPKFDLFRIVRTPEEEIIVDLKGKANGRGAYLQKDLAVIEKAQQSKILEKHLAVPVPDKIYEELKTLL